MPGVAPVPCPDCQGSGIHGGPGGYYDAPGKGKPCGTCKGRKVMPAQNDGSVDNEKGGTS